MSFGQLLKRYINDSETSVRLFSKITELNRGWLYNIFSGKKKLPEDKLHQMLEQFPFSNVQKESLRDAYYKEYYGTENYNKIQFIISELKIISENKYDAFDFPSYSLSNASSLNFIYSKSKLMESIAYLLDSSAGNNDTYICTNFSFAHKDIDALIYSYAAHNKEIDLYHIVNFDSTGDSTHNLRNILRSVKYAQNKFNTYFYYDDNHDMQLDNLFPYFIVTSIGVLLYNKKFTDGLLILDSSVFDDFIIKSKKILEQCKPLVLFTDNPFSLKDYLSQNATGTFSASISFEPCLTSHLTLDMISSISINELPNKKFVINSLDKWIDIAKGSRDSMLNFNTTEGFSKFADSGKITYFPSEYAKPLSKQHRINILKECIKENENSRMFYLLDNSRVTLPDNISIELLPPNTCLIYGCFNGHEHSYLGEFIIQFSSNIILNDFEHFKDYICRNHFYLSDVGTSLFFNDLILKLKTD